MPLRNGPNEPQWPPRSPHEALASTPRGRERLRRMAERGSLSPSPLKKSKSMSALRARSGNMRADAYDDDDDGMDVNDEDEEDEETLRLELQAIQMKLKLKALQKKQKRNADGSSDVESGAISSSRPSSTIPDVLAANRAQSRAAVLAEAPRIRPQSQAQGEVQVPASPVRKVQPPQTQKSPSRVLLGIDKGLRAKDVSLKRASSTRVTSETRDGQTGGFLRRARTPAAGSDGTSSSLSFDRPSFSERLAAARNDEISRKDRQERIRQVRSKTFGVGQDEVERYKSQASEIPDIPSQAESFSREEILAGNGIRQSNSLPGRQVDTSHASDPSVSHLLADTETSIQKPGLKSPSNMPEDEAVSFEPYSGVHLSKRILPHTLLTRTFAGKKVLLVKDLLAQVKAPEFELPDVEQDIIVLGIVASKSEPKTHKVDSTKDRQEKKSRFAEDEDRGKYMVLNIVDLTWQLELFLFNSAFSRYWKLVPGTLVAILNPTVMPPPKGREDTNRFSLVLNSDGDTVLEIGTARDLGFCKSVKKDGDLCNSWVNKKRTEFCEFHMNMALDKHRLARQDINTGSGIGPYKKRGKELWGRKNGNDDRKTRGYDRETHSHFFVSQASASSLLDNDTMLPGQVADRVERGDALKRRLAHQEKEREIMKQLGTAGRGAGREYMNISRGKLGSSISSTNNSVNETYGSTPDDQPELPDAKALGLIAPKGGGAKIHLSPIKRKRTDSANRSTGGFTSNSKTPASGGLGWGGDLRNKLTRMKDGERLDGKEITSGIRSQTSTKDHGSQSSKGNQKTDQPARKKTRFVTEKGIREAGRESLGVDLGKGGLQVSLDSDDELEILM